MPNFSENLMRRLEALSMKPYRLAKLSGLNIQHCYKIVSGDRIPSDETLKKIAAVNELNISLEQLKSWRDLEKCGDLESLLTEIPEDLLLKEIARRFPKLDDLRLKVKSFA
jgi:hypothetical protein